jgi:hypothetical protein
MDATQAPPDRACLDLRMTRRVLFGMGRPLARRVTRRFGVAGALLLALLLGAWGGGPGEGVRASQTGEVAPGAADRSSVATPAPTLSGIGSSVQTLVDRALDPRTGDPLGGVLRGTYSIRPLPAELPTGGPATLGHTARPPPGLS